MEHEVKGEHIVSSAAKRKSGHFEVGDGATVKNHTVNNHRVYSLEAWKCGSRPAGPQR